jgi:hypothetical protein
LERYWATGFDIACNPCCAAVLTSYCVFINLRPPHVLHLCSNPKWLSVFSRISERPPHVEKYRSKISEIIWHCIGLTTSPLFEFRNWSLWSVSTAAFSLQKVCEFQSPQTPPNFRTRLKFWSLLSFCTQHYSRQANRTDCTDLTLFLQSSCFSEATPCVGRCSRLQEMRSLFRKTRCRSEQTAGGNESGRYRKRVGNPMDRPPQPAKGWSATGFRIKDLLEQGTNN